MSHDEPPLVDDLLNDLAAWGYREVFSLGDQGWIISDDDDLWNPSAFRVERVVRATPMHETDPATAVVIAGTAVRSVDRTTHIRRGAILLTDVEDVTDGQVDALRTILEEPPLV